MKINEVIKLSCDFLGLSELKELVGAEDVSGLEKDKLNDMLTCANLAYEEIVTEYLPILTTEEVETEDGKISYSSLSNPISGIISVKDENSGEISYSLSADHIDTRAGKTQITYQIMPQKFDFGDELSVIFPDRLLSYGTAREYLFMQGMSDEAVIYEKRFKEALISFVRKKSLSHLPKRQWKI